MQFTLFLVTAVSLNVNAAPVFSGVSKALSSCFGGGFCKGGGSAVVESANGLAKAKPATAPAQVLTSSLDAPHQKWTAGVNPLRRPALSWDAIQELNKIKPIPN